MAGPPSRGQALSRWLPLRWSAGTALLALAAFSGTAVWTQWVRADRDWVRDTLSMYLHGPWGLELRVAYGLLALAIALLGLSMHVHARGPRRSAAAPLLLVVAALGLLGVAVGDSWLPDLAPAAWMFVHVLSATTAFVCASTGMLLQAWYLRREPGWQRIGVLLWWWAWLVFVLLWTHVLWRGPPRGAGQKLVIALIVGWLLCVAWAGWRRARRPRG